MLKITVFIKNIWDTQANLQQILPTLLPFQIEKANKFKSQEKYLQSITSAYLLNSFTNAQPLAFLPNGKPQKTGEFFNISHSGEFVAIAISPCEVGVDLQQILPFNPRLAKRICAGKLADTKDELFTIWALKESLLKCVGCGIDRPLKNVPDLPLGKKIFDGKEYFSHATIFENYALAITTAGAEMFEMEIKRV